MDTTIVFTTKLAPFVDPTDAPKDASDAHAVGGTELRGLNRLKKIEPTAASSITDASQIIAFRNILAHGYDVVKDEVVWRALETDLSPLIRDVDALLAQGEAEPTGGGVS